MANSLKWLEDQTQTGSPEGPVKYNLTQISNNNQSNCILY